MSKDKPELTSKDKRNSGNSDKGGQDNKYDNVSQAELIEFITKITLTINEQSKELETLRNRIEQLEGGR